MFHRLLPVSGVAIVILLLTIFLTISAAVLPFIELGCIKSAHNMQW